MKQIYKTLLYLVIIAFIIGCKNEIMSPPTYKEISKGTLVIAGIAEDGIVLASDSRVTAFRSFSDGKLIAVSYKDSCQKIFTIHGIPIAIAGRYSFETISLRNLIDSFEAKSQFSTQWKDHDLVSTMFTRIFSDHFPPEKYPGNSVLVTGGYIKGTPYIRKFLVEGRAVISEIIRSRRPVFSDPRAKIIYLNHIKDTSKLLKSKKLAKIFERTIKEFSDSVKTVGGSVSILKINKDNSITVLKNDFSSNPFGEGGEHLIPTSDSAIWNRQLRGWYQ